MRKHPTGTELTHIIPPAFVKFIPIMCEKNFSFHTQIKVYKFADCPIEKECYFQKWTIVNCHQRPKALLFYGCDLVKQSRLQSDPNQKQNRELATIIHVEVEAMITSWN